MVIAAARIVVMEVLAVAVVEVVVADVKAKVADVLGIVLAVPL